MRARDYWENDKNVAPPPSPRTSTRFAAAGNELFRRERDTRVRRNRNRTVLRPGSKYDVERFRNQFEIATRNSTDECA